MHGATNRGFDAMVKLLADHGSRLDVKDKQGRTPMTFAEGCSWRFSRRFENPPR